VRLFFAIENLHLVRVIAGAGDRVGGNGGFNFGDVGGCECDAEGGETLAELGTGTGADDGNDGRVFGESPGDGELRC